MVDENDVRWIFFLSEEFFLTIFGEELGTFYFGGFEFFSRSCVEQNRRGFGGKLRV